MVVIYANGGHKATAGAWYQSDAYTMQKLRRSNPLQSNDDDDAKSWSEGQRSTPVVRMLAFEV
jgi:hypothetical protein